ncbi:MAG: hypothetical protein RLZ23_409 [Actinomycetota bacterium]
MKKLLLITFISLSLISSASDAFAHAQLTDSNPVKNQIIKILPDWIWLEFDGNLMTFGDKNPNSITIFDSKNRLVSDGKSVVGGARLSTKIKGKISAGKYQIKYRIVSEDGHPVQGSIYFTYKP